MVAYAPKCLLRCRCFRRFAVNLLVQFVSTIMSVMPIWHLRAERSADVPTLWARCIQLSKYPFPINVHRNRGCFFLRANLSVLKGAGLSDVIDTPSLRSSLTGRGASLWLIALTIW